MFQLPLESTQQDESIDDDLEPNQTNFLIQISHQLQGIKGFPRLSRAYLFFVSKHLY